MTRYRHVVEIGAGDSRSSEGLSWCTHADLVTLYEPHPVLWADLARAAVGLGNVSVVKEAVTSHFDPLYLMGYASYLKGNPSFLVTSVEPDGEKWWEPLAHEVACQKVDRVDFGTIDYLILTNNGGEMDVLRGLVSRPKRIDTKHMCHNTRQGEEFAKVCDWMWRQGYVGRRLSQNLHGTLQHVCWTLDTPPQPA